MDLTQIDQFLALEGKSLEVGTPHNMANTDISTASYCDHVYKQEVLKDQRGLRVWLTTTYTSAGTPDFVLTVGDKRPFWTLVFSPTSIYRKMVVSPTGAHCMGRIEGPYYFSWTDNRAYFPEGTEPWVPMVARPLPEQVSSYKKAVRWLCQEIKVAAPNSNDIFRPRGLP
jgi:hypothetical protein